MIDVVYSPQWFYGKDIIIDIFSIFVLFLIGYSSLQFYRLKKNKKHAYLALSFFFVGLSFLFKILTNFTIYYNVLETEHLGAFTFIHQEVESSTILFFIGFLLYRILTLLGLYILYSTYQEQPKQHILFVAYLLLILTYFSTSAYYLFHITSLFLLVLITSYYIKNYLKEKRISTKLLATSFGIISASQIIFIFIEVNHIFYVIAELVQLIGYLILLITFIRVLKYDKKT